jgi:YmgG-like glycine-zipper protein
MPSQRSRDGGEPERLAISREARSTDMKKRIATSLMGLSLVALTATACGTATGAAVGAASGAAVGAGTGYGAGKGALIGVGVGAAAGAIYDITR